MVRRVRQAHRRRVRQVLRGTIFPDGKCLVMYRDPARMAAEIARYSASDAKTFTQLVEDYGEFIDSTYLPLGVLAGRVPSARPRTSSRRLLA